ncbi:peptide chain release factor 2 [Buchnera aphidicola (Chaitophorus viminalis)]|nr:peptide chain release factor 2 [Buchnera aphidicola (Chaitophorus viminalis)]
MFKLKKYQEKSQEINEKLQNKNNWKQIKLITKLNKKKKKIDKKINLLKLIKKKIIENKNLLKLSYELNDLSILKDISKNISKIKNKIKNLNFSHMFKKKHDKKNCYIEIQSGSGGIEAQDWSKILFKMYLKWAQKKNFKTKIISVLYDEFNGIRSATIQVKGKYSFGWLRTESGIHRLIRKSPFNTGNKRHTSFSSIFIYPSIKKNKEIKIKKSDLKIDVYKASGAGGQHVNKTESAVRIKHIPTGIIVKCQNNRSQHKNKKYAIQQIISKIFTIKLKNQALKKKKIDSKKLDINWGNQIRSYILDDSRIKDERTKLETREIQKFLNGNLDVFIKKSLKIGL